jgi:protoheme IX farnesyltransferase
MTADTLPELIVRPPSRRALAGVAELFKLRIVALLLCAAMGGAFLGTGGWPGWTALMLVGVTGGLASAGASALNQYLERERDARMRRTRERPLVTGDISDSAWIPAVACAMVVVPSIAVLPENPALAFWVVLGASIYVGVYTVWLKPRTVLNIVIGGAAGSCAAISGGAAVGAWSDPGVLLLGLLVFLWTPAHFWALALMYRRDYARADYPMLPTRTTRRRTALWIMVHAAATAVVALALGGYAGLGWVYTLPTAAATAVLLHRAWRLLRRPSGGRARSVFIASNLYLAWVLAAACLAALL